MKILPISLLAVLLATPAWCDTVLTTVPMFKKAAQTFYVTGRIADLDPHEFMVDTGSSYTTINELTLSQLLVTGSADYVRDLTGVLANGDEMPVPIYRIASLKVGRHCNLDNVEVAIFPGSTRQILGLNALRQASPFVFSVEPPELRLSNCLQPIVYKVP